VSEDKPQDYRGLMQISVECKNGVCAIILEHIKWMEWRTSRKLKNTGALTVHMKDESQVLFVGNAQETFNIASAINQQVKSHAIQKAPNVNFKPIAGISVSITNPEKDAHRKPFQVPMSFKLL